MDQAANDLLAGLRDIHASAEPGWWPPAPGWWLAALLVMAVLLLAVRWLGRRWRAHQRRQRYLRALERIERTIDPAREPAAFAAQISRLIRAVALRAFPGRDSARLQGEEWVRFVRSRLSDGDAARALAALATAPYQPRPAFDAGALTSAARHWILRHG